MGNFFRSAEKLFLVSYRKLNFKRGQLVTIDTYISLVISSYTLFYCTAGRTSTFKRNKINILYAGEFTTIEYHIYVEPL